MKCLPVLLAACMGTFVYVAVSITGGHDGIGAERQLAEQKRILSIHTAEIQKINDELSLEYAAIQKDPDVIAAYARRLGYVGPNEKLVKITGLRSAPVTLYNTGTVQKRQKIVCLPEWVCKAIGLTVFSLTLLLVLLFEYKHGMIGIKRKNYGSIKGIPVYDLPQN